MKTISLNLYDFDDLQEDVQQQIIEKERWNIMDSCMEAYSTDYHNTLKKFQELTDTYVRGWEVGYEGYNYRVDSDKGPFYENPLDYDKDIYYDELVGKLMFRYINNNIIPYITKGKYYSKVKWVDGKCQYIHRYSRIMTSPDGDCPLTGCCYDYAILQPLLNYYQNWPTYPKSYTYKDLMEECYEAFFKSWHKEYEYWADDEDAIREELHHNNYEDRLYYEDGQVYNGPLNFDYGS